MLNISDQKLNIGCFSSLHNFAGILDKYISVVLTVQCLKKIQLQYRMKHCNCVLQIYKNKVFAQVSEAPFIAIIADDTTDVSVQNQLSLVLIYIYTKLLSCIK